MKFQFFFYHSVLSENGGLSQWGNWTKCDKECGGGYIRRHRRCDNPPPKNGGKFCIGLLTEQIECNVHFCPGKSNYISISINSNYHFILRNKMT